MPILQLFCPRYACCQERNDMSSLFNEHGISRIEDVIFLNADQLDKSVATLKRKFPNHKKIGIGCDSDNFLNKKRVIKLDFLYDFPHIVHFDLSCLASLESDTKALYSLANLEYLQWRSNLPINIEPFQHLKKLSCVDLGDSHLVNHFVRDIYVCGYRDLAFLKGMPNIEKLELRDFKNTNLNGIGVLDSLNSLIVKATRSLIDIHAIQNCCRLRRLEIECVPKIDWSALFHCPQIKELFLRQVIPTCKFLDKMPEIHSFVCKEIQDNDLLPIMNASKLSYVYLYKHKRGYNVSKQEFQERFKRT